ERARSVGDLVPRAELDQIAKPAFDVTRDDNDVAITVARAGENVRSRLTRGERDGDRHIDSEGSAVASGFFGNESALSESRERERRRVAAALLCRHRDIDTGIR